MLQIVTLRGDYFYQIVHLLHHQFDRRCYAI